jgi:hypothetical protein
MTLRTPDFNTVIYREPVETWLCQLEELHGSMFTAVERSKAAQLLAEVYEWGRKRGYESGHKSGFSEANSRARFPDRTGG